MAVQTRAGAAQESYSKKPSRLTLQDLIRQGTNPERSPKTGGKAVSQTPKTTKVSKKPIKKPGMTTMPQKVY